MLVEKKEYRDAGGRKLIMWDKLPGRLSISAPGENGFIFLADTDTVLTIMSDLAQWCNEQGMKRERDN